VDWNLEVSHIATLNERQGGPALLFENVKAMIFPSLLRLHYTKRLAITLGMPTDYTMCKMAEDG